MSACGRLLSSTALFPAFALLMGEALRAGTPPDRPAVTIRARPAVMSGGAKRTVMSGGAKRTVMSGGAKRPAVVIHCGQVIKLSVVADSPGDAGRGEAPGDAGRGEAPRGGDGPGARYRWSAGAGLLFQDDLPEVEWRAPPLPGEATIEVEVNVEGAGPALRAEASFEVKRPSTEGMVWIPAGPFLRGDITGTANTVEVKTIQNAADEPCHAVHLDGYWIDRCPVTHEDYARFLEDAVAQGIARVEDIGVFGEHEGGWVPFYYFKPYDSLLPRHYETKNARRTDFLHWISHDGSRFRVKEGKERYPIVDVSWFGAAAYAAFHGKALPTEAQWEKAARGTDGRRYPWGTNLPTSYHGNLNGAYGELSPVGYFSPAGDSPHGVADMLSSCVEWTNDWFNPHYYEDYRGEKPLRNPRGPFWGRSHSIRGSPPSLQWPMMDDVEAVSFRYSWRFEFMIGDIFANRSTTFRTALGAGRDEDGG